ncbi:DUF4917 family protein [Vibrio mediterranei]|uniref:DUF4917 family protein n=1 Tax=Vibrio mediterranei TaxID=689 RepID=UPI001EFE31ED|nr:DUF4917 family protein [Vibrio mediterranei]MCG9628994.1 DUF4917 family protein [Vibrio mediterranei]
MPLQTFEQALAGLNLPEDTKPSILLANGFSQAWSHDIFNYKHLLEKADFGERNASIQSLFDQFETYDFEKIMRALEAAELVCKTYGVEEEKIAEINTDQEQLKDSLIEAISDTHPERSSHVTTEQYEKAKPFILQFKNIFTLNYDLLLYWIANKSEIAPLRNHKDDGFRSPIWENHPNQNVFFLHGGLHLYDTGSKIKKHTFNDEHDVSIIEKVRNNLDDGKFPIFVSEPTHLKKRARIEHNPYLNACYKALKKLGGTLFIHGHSMAENDKHIFDQINDSDVESVFISIYGDENSADNRALKARANQFIDVEINFYDAASAPIWA